MPSRRLLLRTIALAGCSQTVRPQDGPAPARCGRRLHDPAGQVETR